MQKVLLRPQDKASQDFAHLADIHSSNLIGRAYQNKISLRAASGLVAAALTTETLDRQFVAHLGASVVRNGFGGRHALDVSSIRLFIWGSRFSPRSWGLNRLPDMEGASMRGNF